MAGKIKGVMEVSRIHVWGLRLLSNVYFKFLGCQLKWSADNSVGTRAVDHLSQNQRGLTSQNILTDLPLCCALAKPSYLECMNTRL